MIEQTRGVKRGDIYQCGGHTIGCLDSTDKAQISWLFNGLRAVVCHADPPYNMKKAGVTGDSQSHADFDAFQMRWWAVARANMVDNGSAYIWGKPEYLWRLWYMGGLKDSERLTFRNMIVWYKPDGGAGGISHKGMKGIRMYPNYKEHCLFFMLGEQKHEIYWEGWDNIREYLILQRDAMRWTNKRVNTILGTATNGSGMAGHYFKKDNQAQWCLPVESHYKALQTAANGKAFLRQYDDLKRQYDDLLRSFYSTRAYFDNTHALMEDVFKYKVVKGKTRWGHETPKPVEMIERVFKTSARENDIVYCPFLGSGPDLIAAENTNRKLIGCDFEEEWVEVCLERWARWTGIEPVLIGNFYNDTGIRPVVVARVDNKKKIEAKRDLQLKLF